MRLCPPVADEQGRLTVIRIEPILMNAIDVRLPASSHVLWSQSNQFSLTGSQDATDALFLISPAFPRTSLAT